MVKYQVTNVFRGYVHKTDLTNLPPGYLVAGSQNVLFNDGERIASRQGYTLDGDASTALTPILSAYDWQMHTGTEQHLRSYYDELQYRYVDAENVVTWRTLKSGWGDLVNFNYTEFWDTNELIDVLLLVNGTANIYEWSGGVTTYASSTVNTITKEGTTTWGEEAFFTAGTRAVTINGVEYTYTGGENTTTLTGVTPDPTGAGIVAGDIVHQTLRTYANGSATGLALEKNDIISTLNNQVYVGDFNNRSIYVSKVNSFTDYSFASPRVVGEGAILTLDGCPVGLIPQENDMYITAGLSQWYQTNFTLSSDNTDEALTVTRLKTTPQTAAQSQAFIGKIKNYIFFVDNEPSLTTLGKLELIDTPQSVNISDPIKLDFNSYNFTGGCTYYFKNYIYVTVPTSGIVRVFNLAKGFWEAPQILPISRFSIIDGALYGHSSQVPETYKLFDGYNDNGNPINAIAAFSYQNFGDRANNKNMNQMYSEGYITTNTVLNVSILYDYLAASGSASFSIYGSDPVAVKPIGGDGSLGKQSLGIGSLAGREATTDESIPPKFRVINTFPKTDFYECQFIYSSNDVDQRWELLALGPNAMDATSSNSSITAPLN